MSKPRFLIYGNSGGIKDVIEIENELKNIVRRYSMSGKERKAQKYDANGKKLSFEDRALLALSFEDLEFLYKGFPFALEIAKARKIELEKTIEKLVC